MAFFDILSGRMNDLAGFWAYSGTVYRGSEKKWKKFKKFFENPLTSEKVCGILTKLSEKRAVPGDGTRSLKIEQQEKVQS